MKEKITTITKFSVMAILNLLAGMFFTENHFISLFAGFAAGLCACIAIITSLKIVES